VKCEKCGFVSHEFNVTCPSCNKDLAAVRSRLGVHYLPPEVDFDELFTGGSGQYRPTAKPKSQETELDLESVGDEFEFTLDD
jgi:hypothetical protein